MDGGQIAVLRCQGSYSILPIMELELVPVYLMLAIWGGKKRQYALGLSSLFTPQVVLYSFLLQEVAMGFWASNGVEL